MVFESNFLYFVEQLRLRVILYSYFKNCLHGLVNLLFSSEIDAFLILGFSLAEGIYRRIRENEHSVNKVMRVCVPIVFGSVIFLVAQIKTIIYVKVILKTDLSGQKNLIKKGFALPKLN